MELYLFCVYFLSSAAVQIVKKVYSDLDMQLMQGTHNIRTEFWWRDMKGSNCLE
jgi:hypothetical protein